MPPESTQLVPLVVPIRTPDGRSVTSFDAPGDWRAIKQSSLETTVPLDVAGLLAEEHHRTYGRQWVLGRCYFDELLVRGIKPTDRVLDLGCGAGRVGVWLVPFLDVDRYFGVDWHLPSLVAFAAYECLLHDLGGKRPSLMLDDLFNVDRFDVLFDVVLDFNTSVHLPPAQREDLFRRVARSCAPSARLFMPRKPKVDLALLAELGFQLARRDEVDYPLLKTWPEPFRIRDRWYEFVYN